MDVGVAELDKLDIVAANAGICTVQTWDEVTSAVNNMGTTRLSTSAIDLTLVVGQLLNMPEERTRNSAQSPHDSDDSDDSAEKEYRETVYDAMVVALSGRIFLDETVDLTPVPNLPVGGAPAPTFFGAYGQWMQSTPPSWEDVAWLREQWGGAFMLKGVTRIDDAKRAVDAGFPLSRCRTTGGTTWTAPGHHPDAA